jgi:seryl-tRNA synthetase
MEIRKGDITELIDRAKEEVEKAKRSSIEHKKSIDEVNELIEKLEAIKTALAPKQKDLKDSINNLNLILEELSDIKSDIILSKEDEMFNVIDKNLLDGMSLNLSKENENEKIIKFKGERVGSIEVLEECRPDIKIRVEVYDNIDEFPIGNTLKVYSIISFINTKFNYKQQ